MVYGSSPRVPCNDDSGLNQRRAFTTTNEQYVHDIYRSRAGDEELAEFLSSTKVFDSVNKQWSLPEASTITQSLVTCTFKIVRTVLLRFMGHTQGGVEREVRNMAKVNAKQPKNEDGYDACPSLVVRAAGPSFESPTPINAATTRPAVSFLNIASFITVKWELEVGDLKGVLKEMESHARQLFGCQHNRLYVRALLLTEKHARLVHFDRAGIQTTPPINIDRNPATLVRLILGISSTDERLLGLDDSASWAIVDGQKGAGTLTTTDSGGAVKTYTILGQLPVPRDLIKGRGTTCWSVQDPETLETFVVKDSWRPEGLSPEYEILERTRNIPGVVHMVSYEGGRGETKDFRCPTTTGQYHNRFLMRIVLKSYGDPIVFFKSILQVMCAMRDAIAGHQRLSNDGIVHRDISYNNILFGLNGAPDGERGVLIDLEMAFRSTDSSPGIRADHGIGTRIFQSVSVLDSYTPMGSIPDHDYLDDLESFLYVLSYILLLFRPDGSPLPSKEEGPSIVRGWASDDPEAAVLNKSAFYGTGPSSTTALRIIQSTWPPACATLFKEFHDFIMFTAEKKRRLMRRSREDAPRVLLQPLLSLHDEHYAQVLGMFDRAISTMKATETQENSPPEAAVSSIVKTDADVRPSDVGPLYPSTKDRPLQSLNAELPTTDVPAPTTDAAQLAAIPSPPPSKPVVTLRRSTRIRDLHLRATDGGIPLAGIAQKSTTGLPRRSTRVSKRRLDDEGGHPPAPPPKARRTTKSLRSATRAR